MVNASNNLNKVLADIKKVCSNAQDVEIIAVTKYADNKDIKDLLQLNLIKHIGESRVQDAITRWNTKELVEYKDKLTKHFIGHLQTNKVGKALEFFDFIDSVDSLKLAQIINKKAGELGKTINALVQVKLTKKDTQGGASLEDTQQLIEQVKKLENINLLGLMAIAPIEENPENLRPAFKKVKHIFDTNFDSLKDNKKYYLSLGMSTDLQVAIEEGSNLPRIGNAIFG
ncbi:MAG: YggS family pyridoxal phosphate-dependent enzyme [Elusimicrobiaceae bacterium]|jgi:PLP dependent protein|nr:YggS family pyridoxal phosphate-dependent enzyme [Elusimicrobiaceae bacterium]MBT3955056.1 YggS family pyridoxal phosphate-dependent enzyme [Elusimicrobiaceae bacterium]MBT4007826.1 YggS family pyridoxal phosphate-dependent enzyme [Elusimicrobiaceae bacterium]MBT4402842.1 YggS family pyridoxal phosphate-dependent enzyme [Elusimicrobiaceae bacterium]MBT4440255.1 YggS family pyridoxal phosphate-dependent enzyme [Elusimicrobiaceae bacterium]